MYGDDLLGDPQNIEEIVEDEVEEALFLEDDENEGEPSTEPTNEGVDPTTDTDPTGKVEPKKKRVVQRPQPKLNPERLTGPRGVATLEDAFKDFKFLGKGYEKEDLDQVMKHLEHWCHRLYPRFQFDDCLEKIEALGHKKPVMTYVKKIRMGMVTNEEPLILHDDEAENTPALDDQPPIDEFDALISQQLSHIRPTAPQPPAQLSSGLTAEQRERMLRNRLLAEERRLARLKAQAEKETNNVESSSQLTTYNSHENKSSEPLFLSSTPGDPQEFHGFQNPSLTSKDISVAESAQDDVTSQATLEESSHINNLPQTLEVVTATERSSDISQDVNS